MICRPLADTHMGVRIALARAVLTDLLTKSGVIDNPASLPEIVKELQAHPDRYIKLLTAHVVNDDALKALRGLPKFSIEEGSIGADARAMGAASLSLFANYIIDRDVLFKEAF